MDFAPIANQPQLSLKLCTMLLEPGIATPIMSCTTHRYTSRTDAGVVRHEAPITSRAVVPTSADHRLSATGAGFEAAARIKVQELLWGQPLPWGGAGASFDLVLGSDLCYDADLFPLLLATIRQLTNHNPTAQVHALLHPHPILSGSYHLLGQGRP